MKKLLISAGFAIMAFSGYTQATIIGDSSGGLWDYDSTTNSKMLIGNTSVMLDIALDPYTDTLYGISGGSLFSIDQTTAAQTRIGSTNGGINGLTFGSDGTLYGSGGNSLYSIDLTTGSSSKIGSGSYSSSGDIAFDNLGNLFLSSSTGSTNSLWTVDINTGVGTLIGDIGYNAVYGLNYTGGTLYGFTQSGLTLALDTSTGAGVELFTNGINTYGADGVGGVAAVPEPASVLLFGFGIAALVMSRRITAGKKLA